jgi:hypothetical protein
VRLRGRERRGRRADAWGRAGSGKGGTRALGLVSGVGPRGASGREGRMSGWAAGPRGKELGRQVWAAEVWGGWECGHGLG